LNYLNTDKMKKEIKLVPFKMADFPQVILLLKQLWPNKKINNRNLSKTIKEQLKDPKKYLILMIKDKDKTIGLITVSSRLTWEFEGNLGSIDEFVIDKKYQNLGIGTQVIQKTMKICKKQRTKGIYLISAFHRKEAHCFYEKNGFKKGSYQFEQAL